MDKRVDAGAPQRAVLETEKCCPLCGVPPALLVEAATMLRELVEAGERTAMGRGASRRGKVTAGRGTPRSSVRGRPR